MGVVIPIGYAQVNLRFFLTGDVQPMVVTFGCQPDAPGDPEDLADVAEVAFVNAGTIFEAASFSDAYRIGPFEATVMTATGPQTGTGVLQRSGTNAGTLPMPNNVAILVQKRTDRGGRKGRGRAYFPPLYPTEGAISAIGDLTPVTEVAWQDAMTEFLLAMDTAGAPLVLLHSEEAGAIDPDPITSLRVETKVATQRTRLRP